MGKDKRAEIVEAMAEELHRTDRPHDPEWNALTEQTRVAYRVLAEAALVTAFKAAAEIARNACLAPPDGGAPTATESEMCDRAADAILALTIEGMSYEVNMARAELRAERAAAKREARGTSEKALPVECASCGWTGKRKTGNLVFCPKCGKPAGFR